MVVNKYHLSQINIENEVFTGISKKLRWFGFKPLQAPMLQHYWNTRLFLFGP
jgi:hypothetical protein